MRGVITALTLILLTSCSGLNTGKALPCTYASTWTTVDDYTVGTGAFGQRTVVDSNGIVYVAIEEYPTASTGQWMVRSSANAGKSWTTAYTSTFTGAQNNVGTRGFFADQAGNVYLSGFAKDSGANFYCLMQKGANGGTVWTNIDTYQYAATKDTQCANGTIDASGGLYQSTSTQDGSSNYSWTIRRSTNGGSSWSLIDPLFFLNSTFTTTPVSTYVDSKGVIYGVGYGSNLSLADMRWVVRRSTDNGQSWTTVDSYSYATNQQTQGFFLATLSNGTLFGVGYGNDAGTVSHWLSRKSTDNGLTWSAMQDYQYQSGFSSQPQSIIFNHYGNLVVGGWGYDNGSPSAKHWITRISADGGVNWTLSDNFQLAAGQDSRLTGLSVDASGNLYASGSATDSNGLPHSLVRKLACTATTVVY